MNVSAPKEIPNFTGFVKFKCSSSEAADLKYAIKESLPDCFIFSNKKNNENRTYYILTDKHADKFLKKIRKMNFGDLRENLEKVFKEKAKKIDVEELREKIAKGRLDI